MSDMCVILFPQTITKVLLQYCALLAKSFPSYCEKEKIVSTAASPLFYQTASLWAHLWFGERPSTVKAGALSVECINILVAAAHFCNSLTSISVVFFLFGSFVFLSPPLFVPGFHSFALLFLLSLTFVTFYLPHSVFFVFSCTCCLPPSVFLQPCVLMNNIQQMRVLLEKMFESMGAKQVSVQTRLTLVPQQWRFNHLPLRPESLKFFISTCSHWFTGDVFLSGSRSKYWNENLQCL